MELDRQRDAGSTRLIVSERKENRNIGGQCEGGNASISNIHR